MPTPPVSDDQSQTTETVSQPITSSSAGSSSLRHHLTSIASAGLFISFFLPWINLLGSQLNGLDIQRNFSSYKFVWIMPLLAIIALVMNIAKLPTRSISQLAGVSPYAILFYTAYYLDSNVSDLSKLLEFGAWLALLFGAVLGLAPGKPKKPSTPA